jgi:predicted SAM-dependent methyltransferase
MTSPIRDLLRDKIPFVSPVLRRVKANVRLRRHNRAVEIKIKRILEQRSEIFLELGAGDKKGVGNWVTVDVAGNSDIQWDLTKGLPFPNETIAKIYSSHVFEHFSFKEGQNLLEECRRVLIPDGEFSICVPNARLYIEAYAKAQLLDEDTFFTWKPAYNYTTRIDYVNYMAFMDDQHKYMFDEENLLHILKQRGFKNARLRHFDPALDREERDYESIYAEAEK